MRKRHMSVKATIIGQTVVLFLLAFPTCGFLYAGQSGTAERPEAVGEVRDLCPDEQIQQILTSLADSIRNEDSEATQKHLDEMRNLSGRGRDYKKLISQLVLYAIEIENKGNASVIEAMLPAIVMEQLTIPNGQVVAALIPYLHSTDAAIRRFAKEMLRSQEGRTATRPPDFSYYHSFLQARGEQGLKVRRELVLYLYETDLGEAVLTIMRATIRNSQEMKPILWTEHQVSDVLWQWQFSFLRRDQVTPGAAEALADLVDHPQWWARLYVAEIMRQHPAFRTDELIEALIADPDESVRSVTESFAATDPEARQGRR